MVTESHIQISGGKLYCRISNLEPGKPAVLLIHGLGESGLCFNEAFEHLDVGLIVPDLLGFGRSLCDVEPVDYKCEAQIARLWELVDSLGVESLAVIGHSIGGDLGTMMAASQPGSERIRGLINVEGNVTASDTFISSEAFRAVRTGIFDTWFHDHFMRDKVLDTWAREKESAQRYFASLNFCKPEAFSALAEDAVIRNLPRAGALGTGIGELFRNLDTPHSYYWGSESLAKETVHFLDVEGLPNVKFDAAGHWIMIDQPVDFYSSAKKFLRGLDW